MGIEAQKMRVAFQGEPGAFSEAAAVQLLGEGITPVPRTTFDSLFRAVAEGAADAILAPVENSLAGSVVRVYDLLVQSDLTIVGETILPIEMNLIAHPGATLADIKTVSSHPMALAQCEGFFNAHPHFKRTPAEDTAGSVREMMARSDNSYAAIAGGRAASHYHAAILAERIQDNAENFTRFVLLLPPAVAGRTNSGSEARKMSIALRLAHQPGALLAALEPFARHGVNLLKIESRPIHGSPWEYQFFMDIETDSAQRMQTALDEVRKATSALRVLGLYAAAKATSRS